MPWEDVVEDTALILLCFRVAIEGMCAVVATWAHGRCLQRLCVCACVCVCVCI